MVFWGHWFPPRNERKYVTLRYYNSKVEFARSFLGGNRWSENDFAINWPLIAQKKTKDGVKQEQTSVIVLL